MANAEMVTRINRPQSKPQNGWRNAFIGMVVLALIVVGGLWAYQTGRLGESPASTTPTIAAGAAGVPPEPGAGRFAQRPGAQAPDTGSAADPAADAAVDAAPVAVVADAALSATTATDAASAAAAPVSIPAIAGVQGTQVWSDGGSLLTTLDSGLKLTASGRSADSTWLAVTTASGPGWVQATQVIAYGLYKLPELALPATLAAGVPDLAAAIEAPAVAVTETLPVADAQPLLAAVENTTETPPAATRATATVVSDGRLNVRSGPGTDYAIVTKANKGDEYVVLGRNAAGDWLQIQPADGAQDSGWVKAEFVQMGGTVADLPVVTPTAASQAIVKTPVASSNETATASLVASIAQAMPESASVQAAAFSAAETDLQGTLVFQQSSGGMIYAYNLATGTLQQLTNGSDPAISPDGSTVAFVRDGGAAGLYLFDSYGSNERLIYSGNGNIASPKWSPDGQWIVFGRNDDYTECYDVGFNQCLSLDELLKRFPNPDPTRFPLVKDYQYELAAVDANGQNNHDIAALTSAKAPDWSDGGIVYQSAAGLQRTADTTDATNQLVTFDNLKPFYYDPDWQPGNGQIVFQVKGAAQWDIYVVNPDGSGMTALTRPVTTLVDQLPSNVAPAYSPDGKHIVFLSNRTDANDAGAWRLWVMDASGANQRVLPIDVPIDYTFGSEQAVSWGL